MMLMDAGAGALDYSPCRYGASKAMFRGPKRDLTQPYVAILGGSASFGKYVAQPYPALLEQALGLPVANLAALNAGPDLYLGDPATLEIAGKARVAVVQITGAETLTNPLYTVHSRRNDRFLAATPALRDLYPDVDFTEIHFTRHLLMVLQRTDPLRFDRVLGVLQATWLQRMVALLAALQGMGGDLIKVVPSPAAQSEGPAGMHFPETEMQQARALPGAAIHLEVAARLAPEIARLAASENGATLR